MRALLPLIPLLALAAAPAPPAGAPNFAPDAKIPFGSAPEQHVDLWMPAGAGPFPVVVFIHGGCWRVAETGPKDYWPFLRALTARGLAVWSVNYRAVGRPGGGYPGMYQDVARGSDLLGRNAARFHLDLGRVVIAGHSAGGHLALWDAARSRLPGSSALAGVPTLRPRAVINMAGPGMLAAGGGPGAADKVCGPGTGAGVLGAATPDRPDPGADTDPSRLLPLGLPTIQITGSADDTVPSALLIAYDRRAAAAGDPVHTFIQSGANHIDMVDPRKSAFAEAAALIAHAAGAD